MYESTLTAAGLTADQALVYETLLKTGPQTARQIAQKTPLKRTLIYKILDDLAGLGLVVRHDEVGKVSVFEPAHPLKLKELAEKREEQARLAQTALEGVLGQLTSDFNLSHNKPGVQFYEGLEGIKKVLEDTLVNNTKKELRTFSDLSGYLKYLKDWNENYYSQKRKKLGITERAIVPNNPQAVEYMKGYKASEITEAVLIDHQLYPFHTEINIYEHKVSFVTFSEKALIGVIINDPAFHHTMRSAFDFMWNVGKKLNFAEDPHRSQNQEARSTN